MSNKRKTSAQLEHAVNVILQTKSLAEAATVLQVDPATLWRWRQKEEFQSLLVQRRRELVGDLYTRLAGLSGKTVATLEALMASGTPKDAVRLRAVHEALASLIELYKYVDLADDLAEVKALLKERNNVE
jgi:hypothetical protein